MKKIVAVTMPFVFLTALSAQVTQEDADEIVREHMSQETKPHNIYAKEGLQNEMLITSSAEELLELDYFCWVYYISYGINTGFYLIVNESNGNLLKVNAKNGAEPNCWSEWMTIKILLLANTQWKLAGIVDIQTDILTELEPKDCASCYMLVFETDNIVTTYTTVNLLSSPYVVDYDISNIYFDRFAGTKVGEKGDGGLYTDILNALQYTSFSLQENELRLYYNDKKNYLLYNYEGTAWEPFMDNCK